MNIIEFLAHLESISGNIDEAIIHLRQVLLEIEDMPDTPNSMFRDVYHCVKTAYVALDDAQKVTIV